MKARSRRRLRAAVDRFGGIDILVNNASAISLTGTLDTPMKRFDLMHQVNTRGTFLCSQKAIPHLLKSANPHILNLAPPLPSIVDAKWFAPHVAYTMAKFGMSLCVLGMAEEFRAQGLAVNALWPRTTIDTEAIRLIAGQAARRMTRSPAIMAGRRVLGAHPAQPGRHRAVSDRRRRAAQRGCDRLLALSRPRGRRG
jgi:citronellol/citronellal dehydrogenase